MNFNRFNAPPKKVVASIEARMSSTRLPGKVLADINGVPALTRLLRRLRQCKTLDDIILATSILPADDVLEEWAKKEGVKYYRGSENNVLQRVVEAHRSVATDIVVEITGDCILTDPEIVDMAVQTFFYNDCHLATNCYSPSFPPGLYAQVFHFSDLEKVDKENRDSAAQEHVSLYFYEHPELFRIIHMVAPPNWLLPRDYRIYLDYPEDLVFLREIYRHLEPRFGDGFMAQEIVSFLKENPELSEINRHCKDKSIR